MFPHHTTRSREQRFKFLFGPEPPLLGAKDTERTCVVFFKVMEAREDAKKSALYQKQPNFPPAGKQAEPGAGRTDSQ